MKISTCLLIIIICCIQPARAQQAPVEIRIDPDQPMGSAVSKLFRSVQYIPLETNKDNLFGQVDKLYVLDSVFIVVDYATNAVYVFQKDGRFRTKVLLPPKTDAFWGVRYLNVDYGRQAFSFKSPSDEIKTYDINGRLLATEKDVNAVAHFQTLDGVRVYLECNYNYKRPKTDTLDHELKWRSDETLLKAAWPYQPFNKVINNDDRLGNFEGVFFSSGDAVHLLRPYDPLVYKISSDTVMAAFRFVFPLALTLPADFMTSPAYFGKRINYVRFTAPKAIYGTACFYQVKNWVFFKLLSGGGLEHSSFLYNLANGGFYSVSHLAPDASNYWLPIGMVNAFATGNFITHSFLAADHQAVYAAISSREMFTGREAAKQKNATYNAVLDEYFAHSDKKSNPVIIQMIPR
ncbi:6-bladed beta-propeller [Chitinophaga horti]|uniref:6-bladed beta-propeller n=1 Tax=Chitinophaga horti TaxID=2920382 RepID=A0ABY6J178_9BACT|nr:6-bladed beta-propeller [Chitinophaga horti]UYQ93390.1 6-bladed beta-propeller [Chitinophaga horti]